MWQQWGKQRPEIHTLTKKEKKDKTNTHTRAHSQQLLKPHSFVSKPITDFVHMARPEEKKSILFQTKSRFLLSLYLFCLSSPHCFISPSPSLSLPFSLSTSATPWSLRKPFKRQTVATALRRTLTELQPLRWIDSNFESVSLDAGSLPVVLASGSDQSSLSLSLHFTTTWTMAVWANSEEAWDGLQLCQRPRTEPPHPPREVGAQPRRCWKAHLLLRADISTQSRQAEGRERTS